MDVIAGSSEFLRLGRDHGYSAARAGVGENVAALGIFSYSAGGVWIATHSKSVGFKRLWIGDGQSLHQHTACALSSFAQQAGVFCVFAMPDFHSAREGHHLAENSPMVVHSGECGTGSISGMLAGLRDGTYCQTTSSVFQLLCHHDWHRYVNYANS